MSSLVLGTAQLGMPYGVANKIGKPNERAAIEIIRAAWEGGIREFDTAQEYGSSEEVLGRAFRVLEIGGKVRVISKLAKDIDLEDGKAVVQAIKSSLARLGVQKLFALLLHKEDLLDRWQEMLVGSSFYELVEHFGVSVYSPPRALQALEIDGIDIVQVPANIFDQRFEKVGVFTKAKERDKVIYVRSAFLQGLLLMKLDAVPLHMAFAKSAVQRVGALASELGLSNLELALGYVREAFPSARIVIGAETAVQIREIISAWYSEKFSNITHRVRALFPVVDPRIIDPRVWPKCN